VFEPCKTQFALPRGDAVSRIWKLTGHRAGRVTY
jgi:hypothetical protein